MFAITIQVKILSSNIFLIPVLDAFVGIRFKAEQSLILFHESKETVV